MSMVTKVLIEEMGLKDITIAASSLGDVQDLIADYIEQGKVVGIQTSSIRGRIGEVVSAGKLKTPAIIRSHGGRARAIEAEEVHIDIAFLVAASSDEWGNAKGTGGKNNFGSIGFGIGDSRYVDNTVIITDIVVDFPNLPAPISTIDVDCVCLVDEIGNPKKIASKEARFRDIPRELIMTENAAKIIATTPYFKDGFSFQTGAGSPSLAVNRFIEEYMLERNIKMSFALEIDTNFNVNVITGSDGVLRGAPGGYPDTAAGSKCCIIVTPLTRGRMTTVCENVVTITTPGDCVDILVTDYGTAVNPLRQDLIEWLDKAGIKHVSIEELKNKVYSLVGTPANLKWEDKVVAIVEARDGTILDVVRKIIDKKINLLYYICMHIHIFFKGGLWKK